MAGGSRRWGEPEGGCEFIGICCQEHVGSRLGGAELSGAAGSACELAGAQLSGETSASGNNGCFPKYEIPTSPNTREKWGTRDIATQTKGGLRRGTCGVWG